MAKVYVKFPAAGLGNMLLVWANALVFAKMNQLEMVSGAWWGIRWGAIMRREKNKRFYHNYFTETPYSKKIIFKAKTITWEVKRNPEFEILTDVQKKSKTVFQFDKTITHENLFLNLSPYRDFIKEELLRMITTQKKEQLVKYESPVIGVHVRRGDFKIANQITPLAYFIETINTIREVKKSILPVTVFTDADENELKDLFLLENVKLTDKKADILDILLMSQSEILILSQSSTFSYWAAFLSDAFVIMPHDDWQVKIKEANGNYAEIRWNGSNSQSKNKLRKILQRMEI
jgi:hypothetical protein